MPEIIEIAFKGNRKEFFLWDGTELPPLRAAVIVEADRGEDLGRVHATAEQAAHRHRGTPHGHGGAVPAFRALRLAAPEDVRRLDELREQDEPARRRAMERVQANGLVMKVSDAEWQWDRRKLTLYFTAEKRVDFRTLVRELAAMFRTRIELKQIGVRDEAKRLDGVGRCGRPYCSSTWLPELRPVNLGVAKDQRLSLNPSQISGACGRLMCCLRYEHDFYVQSRRRFPKEGRSVITPRGEEKVIANDIFRDRVTLRGADGELRLVPLAELRKELGGGSDTAPEVQTQASSVEDEIGAGDEGAMAAGDVSIAEPLRRAPLPVLRGPPPDEHVAPALPAEQHQIVPAASDPAPTTEGASAERRGRRRGRRGGRRGRGGGPPDAPLDARDPTAD